MWWDLTEITLFDSVLFSLLSIFTMYFVGFGVLNLINVLSKKTYTLQKFDFSRSLNFRIFFGFVFIFLFLYLLSVFNTPFLLSTIIILAIAGVGLIAAHRKLKILWPKKIFDKKNIEKLIVLVILFMTLLSTSILVAGNYGSTTDDGADHTLLTRIILDYPNALITRSTQPYANIPLNYPVATHALSAFLLTVFSVPIEKIIIMMSAILPALIALSFYFASKCLFENKYLSILCLILAAYFTISLTWLPISWGGIPYLLSLYISITSIGIIYEFVLKNKMTIVNAFLLGLIFFIASRTYPVALLFVTLWFSLVLVAKLMPKLRKIQRRNLSFKSIGNKTTIAISIAFLVPIILSVPYFSFIVTQNMNVITSSKLDSVSSSAAEVVKAQVGFDWLLNVPALMHFFSIFGTLFLLVPLSLIPILALLILKFKQKSAEQAKSKEFRRNLILVYLFMLLLMGYLTITLFLPINFLTSFLNPQRVLQHVFIPATILTTVVLFSCGYLLYLPLKRLFNSGKTSQTRLRNKMLTCFLLILIISGVFLSINPVIKDQQLGFTDAKSLFGKFQTIKQNDLQMMYWIKENISSSQEILVSWGDSGQFLSAICQRQAVSLYSRLQNYSDLMGFLTANASDLRAIPLMVKYNISYVYIGSTATSYALQLPYYRHFNATQFLSTPYFSLSNQVGNAWLFKFNSSAALSVYYDVSN